MKKIKNLLSFFLCLILLSSCNSYLFDKKPDSPSDGTANLTIEIDTSIYYYENLIPEINEGLGELDFSFSSSDSGSIFLFKSNKVKHPNFPLAYNDILYAKLYNETNQKTVTTSNTSTNFITSTSYESLNNYYGLVSGEINFEGKVKIGNDSVLVKVYGSYSNAVMVEYYDN